MNTTMTGAEPNVRNSQPSAVPNRLSSTTVVSTHGPTRVMIVDDHPVVRKGISACIARLPDVTIVGEAQNGAEALQKMSALRPDIVLLDLDMPHTSGLAVVDQFRIRFPEVKIIMHTMYGQSEFIVRAVQAGARGYVLKDSSAQELLDAIERVGAGECYFSKEVTQVALTRFIQGHRDTGHENLTDREREVLVQIAEGLSNKEIAWLLNIGTRTVETHRERIMRKLKIHSTAGLTRYAIAKRMIAVQLPTLNLN